MIDLTAVTKPCTIGTEIRSGNFEIKSCEEECRSGKIHCQYLVLNAYFGSF